MNSKSPTQKPETNECHEEAKGTLELWAKESKNTQLSKSNSSVSVKKEETKPVPAEVPKDSKKKSQVSSRSASEKTGTKNTSPEKPKTLSKSKRQESRQKSEKAKKEDEKWSP